MGNKQCCGISCKDETAMRETKNASLKPTMRDKKKEKKLKKKKKNGAVVEQVMKEPVSEISALETEARSREEVTVQIEHRVSELVPDENLCTR